MGEKIRHLLNMAQDTSEFYELAHEIMMNGNKSQQKVALRLIGQAMGEDEVPVTDAMIQDYLAVHTEEDD